MLTVVLIIPPSSFLLDERVFVSLGVLRVAANLEKQGVVVNVLDLSGIANYVEVIEKFFVNQRFDWVGLTATTPQLPAVFNIARMIRIVNPHLKLVLGGPHVTLTYSALKIEKKNNIHWEGRAKKAAQQLETMFDVLIAGDGELAALEVHLPDCPKVIDADDMKSRWFLSDQAYENLPMPARHLIDLSSYHYAIENHQATSLIAQLGCPFHCGFCGGRNSKSLRVIRTRSTASIIEEIKYLYQTFGYTGFMFYDDELNVNKGLVHLMTELILLQRTLGVEFRLRGFVKAELFTEEQAQAMYRAGFRWLLCGFEAANPRILTNIEKRATIEDNTQAIKIAKKYGLKIKALMSVGHPGETEQSINEISRWLIDMQVDDFDCTIITTYPGTPYYDRAIPHQSLANVWTYTQPKTGDTLHAYELDFSTTPDYYKGDPNGGYRSYVFTDSLSAESIVNLRNELEHKVRRTLNIPFNPSHPAIRYEHSMGQSLPPIILKPFARSFANG